MLYICVSFWFLAHESRDLSQAETKITLVKKTEQIHKKTTVFTTLKMIMECLSYKFPKNDIISSQEKNWQFFFHIIFYQDSHKKYSLQKMSLNVWSLQFSKQVPNGTFWPIWKMIPLLRYLEKVFHPWLILWKKWQFFFFLSRSKGEEEI